MFHRASHRHLHSDLRKLNSDLEPCTRNMTFFFTVCAQSLEITFSTVSDIWSSNPETSDGELLLHAQASRVIPCFSPNALWVQVGRVLPGGEAGEDRPGGRGKYGCSCEHQRLLWLQVLPQSLSSLSLSDEWTGLACSQWRTARPVGKAGGASESVGIEKSKYYSVLICNAQ